MVNKQSVNFNKFRIKQMLSFSVSLFLSPAYTHTRTHVSLLLSVFAFVWSIVAVCDAVHVDSKQCFSSLDSVEFVRATGAIVWLLLEFRSLFVTITGGRWPLIAIELSDLLSSPNFASRLFAFSRRRKNILINILFAVSR